MSSMTTVTRVSAQGRDWRERARKRAADVLVRWANRLDPGRAVVTAGVDSSYTVSVAGTPLARIESGMIRDTRVVPGGYTAGGRGPFRAEDASPLSLAEAAQLAGHTTSTAPGGTDHVRDMVASAYPDAAGEVMARDQVVEKWCREHGKTKDALSIEDIMTIRALPEWKQAG